MSTDSRDERVWVVSWCSIEAMMVVEASENSGRTLRKLSLPILSVRDARSCTSLQIRRVVRCAHSCAAAEDTASGCVVVVEVGIRGRVG